MTEKSFGAKYLVGVMERVSPKITRQDGHKHHVTVQSLSWTYLFVAYYSGTLQPRSFEQSTSQHVRPCHHDCCSDSDHLCHCVLAILPSQVLLTKVSLINSIAHVVRDGIGLVDLPQIPVDLLIDTGIPNLTCNKSPGSN